MRIKPHDIAGSETDGDVLTTVGGVPAWGPAPTGSTSATAFIPLVTATGGVPELVWDSNDELVLTEVTL